MQYSSFNYALYVPARGMAALKAIYLSFIRSAASIMAGGITMKRDHGELKRWSLSQWNVKGKASLKWRKIYFYFLLLGATLHTFTTIIITPPIFKALNGQTLAVWQIYIWLFIASSLCFLGGSLMEFYLQMKCSKSILMKISMLVCLASAFIYVFGALRLGEKVDHRFSGNLVCLIACSTLLAGRLLRILIMTKMRWISALILSQNDELRYEARFLLVGAFEAGASGLFIAFSYWYYFYQYAAGLLLVSSLLRLQIVYKFYSKCIIHKGEETFQLKGQQIDQLKSEISSGVN